jgi:hypothetical protein
MFEMNASLLGHVSEFDWAGRTGGGRSCRAARRSGRIAHAQSSDGAQHTADLAAILRQCVISFRENSQTFVVLAAEGAVRCALPIPCYALAATPAPLLGAGVRRESIHISTSIAAGPTINSA